MQVGLAGGVLEPGTRVMVTVRCDQGNEDLPKSYRLGEWVVPYPLKVRITGTSVDYDFKWRRNYPRRRIGFVLDSVEIKKESQAISNALNGVTEVTDEILEEQNKRLDVLSLKRALLAQAFLASDPELLYAAYRQGVDITKIIDLDIKARIKGRRSAINKAWHETAGFYDLDFSA